MIWWNGLIIAVFFGLILIIQESPIYPVVNTSDPSSPALDESYTIVDLQAPALSGFLLEVFSYTVTRTFLRPFIIRGLLKRNGVDDIRELVDKIPYLLPPTYYPVHRLKQNEYQQHVRAAQQSKTLLSDGLHTSLLLNYTPVSPPLPGRTKKQQAVDTGATYRTVMDYNRLYKSGKATPSQVMEKVLEGCDLLEERLHIFSSFIPKDVRLQAENSNIRWKVGQPLSIFDGVPVVVKDMIAVNGHKVCFGGSNCVNNKESDDELVASFRDAGAIILGLVTMTEGGVTPLGYSLAFDGPFNPYDPRYYPGGSSSGSAVAVATGLVPVSVGFDGGGSIRVPASMSGVFGLATTFGRIVSEGPVGNTMTKGGPIAATAEDTALAYLVMGQPKKDSYFSNLIGEDQIPPPHIEGLIDPVKGLKLGIYWDHFQHSDPEVVEECQKVVEFLKSEGAEIVNITIPHLRQLHMAHGLKILSEFALAWDSAFHQHKATLEPNTAITVAMGKQLSAIEVLACDALRTFGLDHVRNKLFKDMKLDAIVSPTIGSKVPKPPSNYRYSGENNVALVYKVMRFVPLANLLGLPGLSIPIGYEKDTGLPIGFQVMGDAWDESTLLSIAYTIETKYTKRRRPKDNYFDPLAEWLGSS